MAVNTECMFCSRARRVKHIFVVDSVGTSTQDHLQGILSKKDPPFSGALRESVHREECATVKDYIQHLKRGHIGHRPESPRRSQLGLMQGDCSGQTRSDDKEFAHEYLCSARPRGAARTPSHGLSLVQPSCS
eukprot:1060644-Amphidinium_carterae.2